MKVKELIRDSVWIPGGDYGRGKVEISVILPTFRRFKSGLFEQCVDSILAQSLTDIELILVDDCSFDGTFERIARYMAADGRVSCIRHARNVGLPAVSGYEAYCRSRGAHLAYAFDDCHVLPDAYARLLEELTARKAEIVFGYVSFVNASGRKEYCGRNLAPKDLVHLRDNNFIPNLGFLFRREVLEAVGHYDPHISLIRMCDWDLWRRFIKHYTVWPVDVYVGHEFGTVLADSLGNSFEYNYPLAEAQMRQDRDEALSTGNFPEYNVVATPGGLTMEEISGYHAFAENNFANRFWYSADPFQQTGRDAE